MNLVISVTMICPGYDGDICSDDRNFTGFDLDPFLSLIASIFKPWENPSLPVSKNFTE